MAKKDSTKSAIVVEIVSPSEVKISKEGSFSFEYKKVKIETPAGVTYDKEFIFNAYGNKLRKHKVDLGEFFKAYLQGMKKRK